MKTKSIYYIATVNALKSGEFISVHQMVNDLSDSVWFDREHCEAEVTKALKENR